MSNSPIPTRPLTVLALDPGKINFAAARLDPETGRILDTYMLKTPISDLEQPHLSRQALAFAKDVRALLVDPRFQVRSLAIERYQQRVGKGSGASIEYCNTMQGCVITLCMLSKPYVQVSPVLPVAWKNWLSQLVYGTTQRSKGGMTSAADAFGLTVTKSGKKYPILDHELDAAGLGLYHCCVKLPRSDWLPMYKHARESLHALWSTRELLQKKRV